MQHMYLQAFGLLTCDQSSSRSNPWVGVEFVQGQRDNVLGFCY